MSVQRAGLVMQPEVVASSSAEETVAGGNRHGPDARVKVKPAPGMGPLFLSRIPTTTLNDATRSGGPESVAAAAALQRDETFSSSSSLSRRCDSSGDRPA